MAEITLGGVTVPVVPQRHAYLSHRLGPAIQSAVAGGEGLTPDGLLGWAGDAIYTVLDALVPTLHSRIPAHIFAGYETKEAYAAGEFDEDKAANLAGCPTIHEIKAAFAVALEENGINELVNLGKVMGVDPRLVRALLNQKIAEMGSTDSESASDSPNSPSQSGDSESTSSGTPAPTPTQTDPSDSPSSDSTDS